MDNTSWKYVKPLKNGTAIEEFETKFQIHFPNDLKIILKKYNGGRPPLKLYDTAEEKCKEFKTLLSFNETDIENIYRYFPLESKDKNIVPFASDPAGNLFVLKDNKIFLWNHEQDLTIFLANTFSDFLASLHA